MLLETISKPTEGTALMQLTSCPNRGWLCCDSPKLWFALSATLHCICCNYIVLELKNKLTKKDHATEEWHPLLNFSILVLHKFISVIKPTLVHCVQAWEDEFQLQLWSSCAITPGICEDLLYRCGAFPCFVGGSFTGLFISLHLLNLWPSCSGPVTRADRWLSSRDLLHQADQARWSHAYP